MPNSAAAATDLPKVTAERAEGRTQGLGGEIYGSHDLGVGGWARRGEGIPIWVMDFSPRNESTRERSTYLGLGL